MLQCAIDEDISTNARSSRLEHQPPSKRAIAVAASDNSLSFCSADYIVDMAAGTPGKRMEHK